MWNIIWNYTEVCMIVRATQIHVKSACSRAAAKHDTDCALMCPCTANAGLSLKAPLSFRRFVSFIGLYSGVA